MCIETRGAAGPVQSLVFHRLLPIIFKAPVFFSQLKQSSTYLVMVVLSFFLSYCTELKHVKGFVCRPKAECGDLSVVKRAVPTDTAHR